MCLAEVSGHIFSGQTGIFPRFSSRDNRSVMVLYDYDSNAILAKTLKTNTAPELVRVQTQLIQYLLDRGLRTSTLCIDNECPKALKRFFVENSVDFQMCPPNDHGTNQA